MDIVTAVREGLRRQQTAVDPDPGVGITLTGEVFLQWLKSTDADRVCIELGNTGAIDELSDGVRTELASFRARHALAVRRDVGVWTPPDGTDHSIAELTELAIELASIVVPGSGHPTVYPEVEESSRVGPDEGSRLRHRPLRGPEGLIAPAVQASDFDGGLHLVALTDEVEGWQVIVTTPDGTELRPSIESFSGGYYPWLLDLPCWWIEETREPETSWRLEIDGERAAIAGTRAGTFLPAEERRE